MIIKHITVRNFGSVQFYDAALNSNLNIIDTCFITEISTVIELLLCSKNLRHFCAPSVNKETFISAEVLIDKNLYLVELRPIAEKEGALKITTKDTRGNDKTNFYLSTMTHSKEQDAIENFDGRDESIVSRLCLYRGFDECDTLKDLTDRTNCIVCTQTFRSYLMQYIQTFEPEPINHKKKYKISINKQGRFEVVCPGVSEKIHLSNTEKIVFLYICFLNMTEFWENLEKIRDMHHEKKPILIQNFLEFLDQSTDINALILRTEQLKRQTIILTLSTHKNEESE